MTNYSEDNPRRLMLPGTLEAFLQSNPSKLQKDIMEEKDGKVVKMKAEMYILFYVRGEDRKFIRTMQSMKREEIE